VVKDEISKHHNFMKYKFSHTNQVLMEGLACENNTLAQSDKATIDRSCAP